MVMKNGKLRKQEWLILLKNSVLKFLFERWVHQRDQTISLKFYLFPLARMFVPNILYWNYKYLAPSSNLIFIEFVPEFRLYNTSTMRVGLMVDRLSTASERVGKSGHITRLYVDLFYAILYIYWGRSVCMLLNMPAFGSVSIWKPCSLMWSEYCVAWSKHKK